MPIILMMASIVFCRFSYGQLTINSIHLNTSLISPSTLFHLILTNSGSNTRFSLQGDLVDHKGELVLSFQTIPLDMATGTRTFNAAELAMRTYRYAGSDAGRSAQLFQRLPNGTYTFCLQLRSDSEGEDRLCEEQIVDEFLMLDLVHPWDRDTIDETRPTLTWSLSTSGAPTANARLVLSSMPAERTPTQAMAGERPRVMVPDVRPGTIPYPPTVPDLQRGKCYAWQVEVLDGTRVKERSEPWGFCVRPMTTTRVNKYVRLEGLQTGAVYEVFDDRVYFRYDEPYASSSISCIILGADRTIIIPDAQNESGKNTSMNARNVGANLFELDLQPYHLKSGTYELIVSDEMGKTSNLLINVPH